MPEHSSSGASACACAATEDRSGPTWRLSIGSPPDAAATGRLGSLFALCNGTLGVRAGVEECGVSGGVFLSAAYERIPIGYHERFAGFASTSDTRAPVIDGTGLAVELEDGDRLAEMVSFEQTLELASGVLRRRTSWRTERGATLDVRVERIVPAWGEALVAIRFRLASVDYAGRIGIRSVLADGGDGAAQGEDPRLGAGTGARLERVAQAAGGLEAWALQRARVSGVCVACAQSHRLIGGGVRPGDVVDEDGACGVTLRAELAAGDELELEKFVAYAVGRDAPEAGLRDQARALAQRHAAAGFAALEAEQARELAAFWDDAAIDVPDRPELERALRYNLFQLRQNAPLDGQTGVAAKGISGEGYEGHCFWDAEVFATPVLAVTSPARARSHLTFRAATLEAARRH